VSDGDREVIEEHRSEIQSQFVAVALGAAPHHNGPADGYKQADEGALKRYDINNVMIIHLTL